MGDMTHMRKLAVIAVLAVLGAAFALSIPHASLAATKVDCDAVMQELSSGKKPKVVAADLKISVSSVYRCRRRAREAAKAETKGQKTAAAQAKAAEAKAASSAATSPAAAASPAAKK
jgi:hypothetical protein